MMCRALALSVSLMLLFATSALAATREGAGVFTPPPGWSRKVDNGTTTYVSPDGRASLSIGRSRPYEGALASAVDGYVEKAKALPEYRQESRQPGQPHNASTGQWAGVVYSYREANAYPYQWVVLIGAGGRYVPCTGTFADLKVYNAQGPTFAEVVSKLKLTTTEVLEPGKPALTRFGMDDSLDFLEWLLQVPMTAAQKHTVEVEVRGYWKNKNQHEIEGIVELLAARDQLAVMGAAERDLAREAIATAALAEWRKDQTSAAAKLITELYDAAHKPIADGPPPLTRQAVDAFAEFLYFAAGETAGTTAQPTAEVKSQLASEVVTSYPGMAAVQKELIASMPLIWAALRVAWPDLPASQKKEMVDGWRTNAAIVQLGEALKTAAATAVADAPRDAAGAAPQSVNAGVSAQAGAKSGSNAAAANSVAQDMYRKQMQLQMQQRQFQMMQNIMQSNFDTQRIIISNMGGNTSYSYQWR